MRREYVVHPFGEFAKWLDRQLKEHNMTRNELADQIGISHTTILNYYRQKTRPRDFIIRDISNVFGVPFEKVWKIVLWDWSEE